MIVSIDRKTGKKTCRDEAGETIDFTPLAAAIAEAMINRRKEDETDKNRA